jgi:hypothetical protein
MIHATMANFVFVAVETCIVLLKLLHFELARTADSGAIPAAACVDDCIENWNQYKNKHT